MKKIYIIFVSFLLFAILISFYPIQTLEVYIVDQGSRENEVILEVPIKVNDEFSVKWTHSVSKRPVIETYRINEKLEIDTQEMIFDTFSANLPATPDYETKWEYHEEYIRVYNFDRKYEALPIVIGEVIANHRLLFKGKKYTLKELYKPGGFVKVRVNKKSLYHYLIGEVF